MQEFPQSLASWPWETESDSTLSHHRGLHSLEPSWFLVKVTDTRKAISLPSQFWRGGGGGERSVESAPAPALAQSTHRCHPAAGTVYSSQQRNTKSRGFGIPLFLAPFRSSPTFDLFLPTPLLNRTQTLFLKRTGGSTCPLTSLPPRCRLRSQQTVFSFLIR